MPSIRKLALAALLVLLISLSLCAAPGTEWSQTFDGDEFTNIVDVVQTADAGYLIYGTAAGEEGLSQQKLLKLDAVSNTEWENVYGDDGSEAAWSMIQTLSGSYLFAGRCQQPGEATVSVTMYLVTPSGELEWKRSIGSDWNLTEVNPIVLEHHNGIYCVFGTVSTPEGNGVLHHSYGWGGAVFRDFPCPAFETGIITDAILFGDGSIRFVGNGVSQESEVGLFTFLPSEGGCDWTQQVTEPGGHAYGIELASDGSLIILGTTNGTPHTYLAKYDLSGQQLWYATYGNDVRNLGVAVEATEDGGAVVTGNTADFQGLAGILVFRVDADGELVWSKVLGDRFDTGISIHRTSDGGFIIGANCGPEGIGCEGVRIIKLSPDLE